MKSQFMTMRFGIEIAIAIVLAGIVILAVCYYNPQIKEKTIKVDYFRIPTNNALVVLGLLVPILTALAAYLYTSDPSGQYSFLLASITAISRSKSLSLLACANCSRSLTSWFVIAPAGVSRRR
jgi:hypothetical protein